MRQQAEPPRRAGKLRPAAPRPHPAVRRRAAELGTAVAPRAARALRRAADEAAAMLPRLEELASHPAPGEPRTAPARAETSRPPALTPGRRQVEAIRRRAALGLVAR